MEASFRIAFVISCLSGSEPTTKPDTAAGFEKLPMAMRAMEESRMRLRTGVVEWRRISHTQKVPAARIRRYSYRWANDQFICTFLGNDSGTLRLNPSGTPADIAMRFGGVTSYLFQPGHTTWSHTENDIQAVQYTSQAPPLTGWDPRALGLTAMQPPDGQGLSEIIRKFGGEIVVPREITSRRVGSEYEVTSKSPDGWRHVLIIDPDRGWNPTLITATSNNDSIRIQSRISLRQYGKYWFPERVDYYNTTEKLADPLWTIEVSSARFNESDFPNRLTPSDIGVEIGTVVKIRESWRSAAPPSWARDTPVAWDGKQLVDLHAMNERIEKGSIEIGPNLAAQLQRIRNEPRPPVSISGATITAPGPEWSPGTRLPIDVWEQFVDAFASANALTAIQKNAAQGILKDLHQRAIGEDAARIRELSDELRERLLHLLTPEQRVRISTQAETSLPKTGNTNSAKKD